ncbi:MAG: ribosomal L7Ae/L30e/S12e/Gadd45 family protein [Clostridiales bacterium]|nr:ribosomal L7Ae/L30e/S12e/Gadd45 family protein [Candidatus Equinaster intestinalis]
MESKIKTYLGFASKAGKLKFGMAKTEESAKKGKAELIAFANDVSDKTKKEILFIGNKYNVAVVPLGFSGDELEKAVGSRCLVLALEDNSFAKAIKNSIESI